MPGPRLSTGRRSGPRLGGVPAAILFQAEDWFQRFQAGDLDKRSASVLLAWLEEDPRHLEAFKAAAKGEPDRGVDEIMGHIERANISQVEAESRQPRRWPRFVFLFVVLTIAGMGAFATSKDPTLQNLPQRLGAKHAAGSGDTLNVTLSDGSEVFLGSESALNTDFESSQRFIEFLGGEVLIEVSKTDSRPFILRSAKVTLESIGTRFQIRDDGSKALVTVFEGAVRVEPAKQPGHATVVPANAAVVIEETVGPLRPAAHGNPDAWRRAELPQETLRLGELITELQRFTPGTILLLNGTYAGMELQGPFKTDDIPATLRASLEGEDLTILSLLRGAVVILY